MLIGVWCRAASAPRTTTCWPGGSSGRRWRPSRSLPRGSAPRRASARPAPSTQTGLSATRADPFGYALVIVILAAVFAGPLWRAQITTLGDLFRRRYSPRVEQVAVVLMIPTSILWAGAQIRAFGQVLASASDGMSASVGIAAGHRARCSSTRSSAACWPMRGPICSRASCWPSACIVVTAAGRQRAWRDRPGASPGRVRRTGPGAHPGRRTIEVLNRWAIPILGSITAQELISRIVACRSPQVAQRAAWMASLTYLSIGVLPVALGLMATQVNLDVVDAEHVLPELAATPPADVRLRAVRRRAGVGHPVHGQQLPAGGRIDDLAQPGRAAPARDHRARQAAGRAHRRDGVGLVAWYLALSSDSVLGLVEEASGFGSAGILVLMLFALWSPFGGALAALAALSAGSPCGWRRTSSTRCRTTTWRRSARFGAYFLVGLLERVRPAPAVATPSSSSSSPGRSSTRRFLHERDGAGVFLVGRRLDIERRAGGRGSPSGPSRRSPRPCLDHVEHHRAVFGRRPSSAPVARRP